MELKDLSSNWKKLQQTFKPDPSSEPSKRRPSEDILQLQRSRVKRLKTTNVLVTDHKESTTSAVKHSPRNKKPSMGFSISRSTDSKPVTSASLALWAEDNNISAHDLAAAYGPSRNPTLIPNTTTISNESINIGLSPTVEAGKYIALDCEMVGVGPTPQTDSALARVSLVNYHGEQLYDSFVLPKEAVTDYRTHVSGITPQLLQTARSFEEVQKDVAELMDGKILVGHGIRNDLEALMLGHPRRDIRDTSRHPAFRALAKGRTPALKKLAKEILGVEIQEGEHSSVVDARATMLLFRREKEGFEKEHAKRWGIGRKPDGANGENGRTKKPKKKVKK
ncbi:3'-5' exonuclease [Ptychographa xylographoides]|nr:3'-5' exonuclease [Ptychographa xylographoides]